MPNDEHSLGLYVQDLVRTVEQDDPAAAARLRRVVGAQRATISLDGEVIEVWFDADHTLRTTTDHSGTSDGSGATDRATVLDLLAGRVEASRAILDGRIEVTGAPDAVAALLLAIEILLDVSARSPRLQAISRTFVGYAGERAVAAPAPPPATSWYPRARPAAEDELLARLGLTREHTRKVD